MKIKSKNFNFSVSNKLQYFPENFIEIVTVMQRFQKLNFYKVFQIETEDMLNYNYYIFFSKIFHLYAFLFFNYSLLYNFLVKCVFAQNIKKCKKKNVKNFFFTFFLKKFSFIRFYKKLNFYDTKIIFRNVFKSYIRKSNQSFLLGLRVSFVYRIFKNQKRVLLNSLSHFLSLIYIKAWWVLLKTYFLPVTVRNLVVDVYFKGICFLMKKKTKFLDLKGNLYLNSFVKNLIIKFFTKLFKYRFPFKSKNLVLLDFYDLFFLLSSLSVFGISKEVSLQNNELLENKMSNFDKIRKLFSKKKRLKSLKTKNNIFFSNYSIGNFLKKKKLIFKNTILNSLVDLNLLVKSEKTNLVSKLLKQKEKKYQLYSTRKNKILFFRVFRVFLFSKFKSLLFKNKGKVKFLKKKLLYFKSFFEKEKKRKLHTFKAFFLKKFQIKRKLNLDKVQQKELKNKQLHWTLKLKKMDVFFKQINYVIKILNFFRFNDFLKVLENKFYSIYLVFFFYSERYLCYTFQPQNRISKIKRKNIFELNNFYFNTKSLMRFFFLKKILNFIDLYFNKIKYLLKTKIYLKNLNKLKVATKTFLLKKNIFLETYFYNFYKKYILLLKKYFFLTKLGASGPVLNLSLFFRNQLFFNFENFFQNLNVFQFLKGSNIFIFGHLVHRVGFYFNLVYPKKLLEIAVQKKKILKNLKNKKKNKLFQLLKNKIILNKKNYFFHLQKQFKKRSYWYFSNFSFFINFCKKKKLFYSFSFLNNKSEKNKRINFSFFSFLKKYFFFETLNLTNYSFLSKEIIENHQFFILLRLCDYLRKKNDSNLFLISVPKYIKNILDDKMEQEWNIIFVNLLVKLNLFINWKLIEKTFLLMKGLKSKLPKILNDLVVLFIAFQKFEQQLKNNIKNFSKLSFVQLMFKVIWLNRCYSCQVKRKGTTFKIQKKKTLFEIFFQLPNQDILNWLKYGFTFFRTYLFFYKYLFVIHLYYLNFLFRKMVVLKLFLYYINFYIFLIYNKIRCLRNQFSTIEFYYDLMKYKNNRKPFVMVNATNIALNICLRFKKGLL